MMSKEYRIIDCFCGAGGLSLGFEKAGFKVVYAFDLDEASVNTYKHNPQYHHGPAFVRDIYEVSKKSIEKDLGHKIGKIDVVIGGPPCQGFSVQRRGDDNDPRNNLVLEYIRMILDIKPKFFVMENVGGLLSPRGRPYLEQLKKSCEDAGYVIQRAKLTASDFGVPQSRKRVFIVGEKSEDKKAHFSFPKSDGSPEKTVRDAIADLMYIGEDSIPNHKADKLSFIEMPPREDLVSNPVLRQVMQHLNGYLKKELRSTDLLIGHAYFMNKAAERLPDIMNNSVIPLLYEYFYDDEAKVKRALECLKDTDYELDPKPLGRVRIKKKDSDD